MGLLAAMLVLAGCMTMKPTHPTAPAPMPKTYILFFHPWDHSLTPEAKVIVDQAYAAVKDTHPSTVAVAGYTDNVGSAEENQRLAERRVRTVRDALVADGIDPKLFLDLPLGPPEDSVGKTGDRRIEIRLTYGG
jgi:outer membrane protein OmpA-like peptidoglycan-associated protein